MSPRALVVGGGYAGVSAATALAEAGVPVDLLESRGFLGGRVYSTAPSPSFPAPVDNGPHLLMGCYRETFKLFKRLGAASDFHWVDPLALSWVSPGGARTSLNCLSLPAPFHLLLGLLSSSAFPGSKSSSSWRPWPLSRSDPSPFPRKSARWKIGWASPAKAPPRGSAFGRPFAGR